MNRFAIVDSTPCIGYHTCEAACPGTHRQYGLQSTLHLRVILNEKESTPQFCHHCENALCVVVCPASATTHVDGVVQLNKSLCVNCKLCGIACPFGATEPSGSRPLGIPANANTPRVSPASSAPARVSTLLDWVSGIRVIAVKCNLCDFDEQGPACVQIYPVKALHLVDNTNIARVSRRKCELTFSTDFGDLILSQQAQSGEAK